MKISQTLAWIVAIVALVIGLIVAVITTRPSAAAISAQTQPLPPLAADVTSDGQFIRLNAAALPPNVPVTAAPANPLRSDPFQ